MCDSAKSVVKSRPHGDDASLYINSETIFPDETSLTFGLDKNFTEPILTQRSLTPLIPFINEDAESSELQNERITAAYERAVDSEDISETTEDLDSSLAELRNLNGEISRDYTNSPTSVSVLDKVQNLTGELVSQTFGSGSRRNISSRIEELSKSFSVSQERDRLSSFSLTRSVPSFNYKSANIGTVKRSYRERDLTSTSTTVVSVPAYATPNLKLNLEPGQLRTLTQGGISNAPHTKKEAIAPQGLSSFSGNTKGNIQKDIAYQPTNSAKYEREGNDETEVYPVDSECDSFDLNVARTMNGPLEPLLQHGNCETIASDITMTSISEVLIRNGTRSSRYKEASSRFTRTNQGSVNIAPINNRSLILKWTLANVLVLSMYGALRSYWGKLTLGDMYSVAGYLFGLCIVEFINFIRTE
ncbi:unnamed protein product [Rodentolepis nana]|uniref:Pecanex-like protein n=1 Tax=Rodentolepis nana TaxID=102285 RepID=A0A0R3T5L4_RODNA|nr:unnamed protein product [Rodentolepis nana]